MVQAIRILCLIILCNIANCKNKATEVKACEKEYGQMRGKVHFLSAQFVKENGRLDYRALRKFSRRNNKHLPDPGCIPIQESRSTEEQLIDQEFAE